MLADLTWPQVGEQVGPESILAVPLGATEQHGPHLPLSVDTDVAVALCQGLAAARSDVFVAPALPYGSSGEHAAFPGTLSIGREALEFLLVELARSATDTFPHVLFVSGHGGNAEPLVRAVATLRTEGRDVRAHHPRWHGDPHAGRPETALALALDPTRVHMNLAVPGDLRPLAETLPLMHAGGVRAVSPTGVLGDPTGADAAEGTVLLARLVADLAADVATWRAS
ncbi:MAG: mycofactocin biosynthesis peptidyl-dipeptidase MftE [Sporichthyaceae bacterium]